MDITVAICTWNRADLLDQTLASLAAMPVPAGLRWELLVVDNNSTDHTPQVLAAHAGGPLPLRPLAEPRQGHSHARNRALAEARGGWVLWTDDDVLVDPGWLAGMAAAVGRHPRAAAVGGPVDPWFPHPPDPDLVAAFPVLGIGYCGVDHGPAERELGPDEHVFGANMGFNRAVTGGLRFDTGLGRRAGRLGSGDDVEFVARARQRGPVVWVPAARLRHYVLPERMTVGYARRYVKDNIPAAAGPREAVPHLFGVPRWMVRRYLAAAAAGWLRRPRAERLRQRVARWKLEAQMAAYRRAVGGRA